MSGFHRIVHLHITECFKFLLRCPILEYQEWLFCICSVFPKWPVDIFSLCLGMYDIIPKHLQMQQMQWRDRLAQRDVSRTMDWHNYFSNIFFSTLGGSRSTRTIPDVWTHASDSRGKCFCTQQSCNICSLHIHWDWIPCPNLCVFVCHFLSSLDHKKSAKWIWLSNLFRKSSSFKMTMPLQMVYLQ